MQVGNIILYPLPRGMKPVEQKSLEMPPEVVTHKGLVYGGVHEFRGKFVWAPDSRKVGLVDCLVDYGFGTTRPRLLMKAANERMSGALRWRWGWTAGLPGYR